MKKLAFAFALISLLVIWVLNRATDGMAKETQKIQQQFVEAQSASTNNAPATNVAKARGPVVIRTSVGLGRSTGPTPRPTNQVGEVVGNGTQQ